MEKHIITEQDMLNNPTMEADGLKVGDEIELGDPVSFGQLAVGLHFNPSGDDAVANCKQRIADAIDEMRRLIDEADSPMRTYLADEAIGHLITAQMWCVKALTWKD